CGETSRILLYGRSSVAAPHYKRAGFRTRVQEGPTSHRKRAAFRTRGGHGGPPVQEYLTRRRLCPYLDATDLFSFCICTESVAGHQPVRAYVVEDSRRL